MMSSYARKTAATRNTMLVANSTENVFIPYLIVFYASSHPSNAMEPTKALGPDKSAKSNPSPRQKLTFGRRFLKKSAKIVNLSF